MNRHGVEDVHILHKLNLATKKDHFLLPFIDEMLEQLAKHSFFLFP
jgi:imidazoleglycerol phosphate dehydratase HisB